MSCHQRNINIAGFADGLAIVHAFQHGKQPAVFLDLARQRVQIAGTAMSAYCHPAFQGINRSANRGIHVRRVAVCHLGEQFAVGRAAGFKILTRIRLVPFTGNEVIQRLLALA